MNASQRFYERISADHESLIRSINGLIGKSGIMKYSHKRQEMCMFLSVLKFHNAGTYFDKDGPNQSIECSILLLRQNGQISPRRLVFKTSSKNFLIRPKRHSNLIEIVTL